MNYKLPKADGNERIWQNPISLQHPFSVIEIIAWDSSMTIVITEFDDIIEKLEKSNPIDYILSKGYTFESTGDGLWKAVRR